MTNIKYFTVRDLQDETDVRYNQTENELKEMLITFYENDINSDDIETSSNANQILDDLENGMLLKDIISIIECSDYSVVRQSKYID